MINGLPFQRSWDSRCQIEESLLPVTEVCYKSGFTNIYFNLAFLTRSGMTPSQFRRHGSFRPEHEP